MDIHESIDRVLDSGETLGGKFYETFFHRCPEAKPFFEGVNMPRQAVALTMALFVIEQYDRSSYRALESYLADLGQRHFERGIPKELYSKWQHALLETLEDFHGEQWDENLASQWREAVDRTIELMLKAYQ